MITALCLNELSLKMNVTLTSLEALILKATNENLPCPDSAALEAFCAILKDSVDGPQLAAQALAARIHSSNPKEALLALTMTDKCMRRGDPSFHTEIGKFRFLNEMIKLVSPKYFADRTAPEVRIKVLQLLHAWSIEYPKETKFKVAYDMLKNQGVVKETPPPLPPDDVPTCKSRLKSAIFEDEEKSKLLQKLLQSKKPEDLQQANKLIKTMVREEERRSEASSRRAQEVGAALDSTGLLRDMLEHAENASLDEEQLIHELHASCLRMRPVLQDLAASDISDDNLDDILQASDALDEVIEKYNTFVVESKVKPKIIHSQISNDSLLDFAGAAIVTKENGDKNEEVKNNVIDELGDIFSTAGDSNIAEPLKPVSLVSKDAELLSEKCSKKEGWNELDSLGEQLLKQSLPDSAKRMDSFNSKTSKKIPMNSLEKTSPSQEIATSSNNGAILDLDFFTRKEKPREEMPIQSPIVANDDTMVDISITRTKVETQNSSKSDESMLDLTNNSNSQLTLLKDKEAKTTDVKPLIDLNVTLESVKPSKVAPIVVFEEESGVTVILHFCKDKPRPDVNVIVISTTSKNTSPIEDYKFQAVVPKGCKVRLLTPSGTSLPPYNPFLPPPAVTQVMLIARPETLPTVCLKFVITYTCKEETISEIGEIKQLPLNDI